MSASYWTPDWHKGPPNVLFCGDSHIYRAAMWCWPQEFMNLGPCGTVGTIVDVTGLGPYKFWTEGHSGQRTDQILSGLATWKRSWIRKPTHAVIHAGCNDVIQSIATATIIANLQSIKSLIEAEASGCEVWFCTLMPTKGAYAAFDAGRLALNTDILATFDNVIDVTAGFNSATMMVDDLHCNLAGSIHCGQMVRTALGF